MGKALIIKGANFSSIAVDTIEITVGTPTIQIDIYGNVAITSPNGEDIYYTTDDSTPTNQSTKYTAGFRVQMNTTVKAVCYFGGNYSEVVSVPYNGTLQAPVINIAKNGVVTITATNNASIRYTVDGQTDPTSSSGTEYTEPFNVEKGVVVKAIAYLTSGSTTIISSVTTSEPADVVEPITPNKTFAKGSGLDTTGAITDKEGRFVSPYIELPDGTTTVIWGFAAPKNITDSTNYPLYCCSYSSSRGYLRGKNTNTQDGTSRTLNRASDLDSGSVAKYIRICGVMGSSYSGQFYVKADGVALWTYDGSTE